MNGSDPVGLRSAKHFPNPGALVYEYRMSFPDFEPSIPVFLGHCREQFGDQELVVLGDRRITYAEAEVESARMARGLLAKGVCKGTRVGVLFPNGPDFVIAFMAAAVIVGNEI